VEPENESRSRRHQLEVHTQKGTSEVRLQKEQNQVVRDLVFESSRAISSSIDQA
jgi:hypothetical protein